MKKAFLLLIGLITSLVLYAQGLNNPYPYDTEDLKNILEMQGYKTFKFPFKIKEGEYISISYDVYQFGKKIKEGHFIEDFQTKNDLIINHHIAQKDTTVYLRFYFTEKDDSLIVKNVLPGITGMEKFNISGIALSEISGYGETDESMSGRQQLMFYYGLYQDSEIFKKENETLYCPTGLSKESLIQNYDLIIMYYAERISAERAKNILNENKYKQKL